MRKIAPLVLAAASLAISAIGCSGNADEPYKAQPAWSGKKASMPAPPTIPNLPLKAGDAWTVFGATHHLRSLVHNKDVAGANDITITGYIVETNYAKAPDCALHPAGKKDPEGCAASEIPSFWIADTKGDTKGPKIRIIGWARNFAIIYDAMKAYDKLKPGETLKEPINDDVLNVPIPFPLPVVGQQVKITGKYGVSGRNSGDMVSDPMNGVMMQKKIEVVGTPVAEKAQFAHPIKMKGLFVASAFAAIVGCGGGEASSPGNRYQADPNDPGGSSASSGKPVTGTAASGACGERTGDAFSKCARDLYASKKYADVIATCKTAVNNGAASEADKASALGVCMSLLPSSLFHQGRNQEASEMLGTLCKGSSDEDRVNIAARATLITMLGMDKSVNNEERIKQALVTFAGGCQVDPGRVADRALELSKQ